MKKAVILFVLAALSVACNKKFEGNDYSGLNGYWEIQKVVMPDGTEKDYTMNATIDFFEVKGNKGFRKKTMPQFDGTYRANDVSEDFSIAKQPDDKTVLSYSTPYAKWDEELLVLTKDELVVKNQHNIEYHYKKPEPFTLK